jgi:hypothetical protein
MYGYVRMPHVRTLFGTEQTYGRWGSYRTPNRTVHPYMLEKPSKYNRLVVRTVCPYVGYVRIAIRTSVHVCRAGVSGAVDKKAGQFLKLGRKRHAERITCRASRVTRLLFIFASRVNLLRTHSPSMVRRHS